MATIQLSKVFVEQNAHGTTSVVCLDSNNMSLRSFLQKFDIWGCKGQRVATKNGYAIKYEADREFLDMCFSEKMEHILRTLGAQATMEYPVELA